MARRTQRCLCVTSAFAEGGLLSGDMIIQFRCLIAKEELSGDVFSLGTGGGASCGPPYVSNSFERTVTAYLKCFEEEISATRTNYWVISSPPELGTPLAHCPFRTEAA